MKNNTLAKKINAFAVAGWLGLSSLACVELESIDYEHSKSEMDYYNNPPRIGSLNAGLFGLSVGGFTAGIAYAIILKKKKSEDDYQRVEKEE